MIVLDTTVLLYSLGGDHPLAGPSKRLLESLPSGRLQATTTVEVIQEFVHVRIRRRSRTEAADRAREYVTLLSPLRTVDEADLQRALELFVQHPRLGAFDALLAAAALGAGAEALVSADRDFRAVKELRFVELGSPELDELIAAS